MDINIAANLKRLRGKSNITQETLAERLGVSAQAVSKWERGDGYPDITTIPLIANHFCVTIDELFGFHGEREKQIEETVDKIYKMNKANNGVDICMDECLRLTREAAAEYPGNEKILLCLADMLFNAGYVRYGEYHLTDDDGFDVYDVELHRKYVEWSEAIKLYETLIENMPDSDERRKAKIRLIQLYANTGDYEKGIKVAESFPDLYECRELALAQACDGKERYGYLGKLILETVSLCTSKMVQAYISVNCHCTPETAVMILRNAINMFDCICTDGEYGLYNYDLRLLYLYLSEHQWRAGDHDGAFVSLYKAFEHAKKHDSYNRKSEIMFTSPLLQQVKINPKGYDCLSAVQNLADDWPWWRTPDCSDVFDEIRADPRWDEWVRKTQEQN